MSMTRIYSVFWIFITDFWYECVSEIMSMRFDQFFSSSWILIAGNWLRLFSEYFSVHTLTILILWSLYMLSYVKPKSTISYVLCWVWIWWELQTLNKSRGVGVWVSEIMSMTRIYSCCFVYSLLISDMNTYLKLWVWDSINSSHLLEYSLLITG